MSNYYCVSLPRVFNPVGPKVITSLYSADRDGTNPTNLVDILEWELEGLICGPLRLVDEVEDIKEGEPFVPFKVGGPLDHVVTLKSRDGDKGELMRVVTHLLEMSTLLSPSSRRSYYICVSENTHVFQSRVIIGVGGNKYQCLILVGWVFDHHYNMVLENVREI